MSKFVHILKDKDLSDYDIRDYAISIDSDYNVNQDGNNPSICIKSVDGTDTELSTAGSYAFLYSLATTKPSGYTTITHVSSPSSWSSWIVNSYYYFKATDESQNNVYKCTTAGTKPTTTYDNPNASWNLLLHKNDSSKTALTATELSQLFGTKASLNVSCKAEYFNSMCGTLTYTSGNTYVTLTITNNQHPTNFIPEAYEKNSDNGFIWMYEDPNLSNSDLDKTSLLTIGDLAFSQGYNTHANSLCAHAEGCCTIADGRYSHAEGCNTKSGYASHAEGYSTIANGLYSHSEGCNTAASGNGSHAEGKNTESVGANAHSEGYLTIASGSSSHAEGYSTQAMGKRAHAEGQGTEASGEASHAEGASAKATGLKSHAEGSNTIAGGSYSHAEGRNNKTYLSYSHVQGKYAVDNPASTGFADVVGWGTSDSARKNISSLTQSGDLHLKGTVYVNSDDDGTNGTDIANTVIILKSNTTDAYTKIATALLNNKQVVVIDDSSTTHLQYYYSSRSNDNYYFYRLDTAGSAKKHYLYVNSSNVWTAGSISYEVTTNKVTSISSSSTNTQYPSAKLLYNQLQLKQDSLPAVVNGRYLHTNATTGNLEWSTFGNGTILWHNSNLSSDFATQTAPISTIDDYDFVQIIFLQHKSSTGNTVWLENQTCILDSNISCELHFAQNDSSVVFAHRSVVKTASTASQQGILFGDCVDDLLSSTNNALIIPYVIIGYKF